MPEDPHYRHELDEALAAFDVRDRWDRADANEQLAVLQWLETTPPAERTRLARRVAQWLSADHPLVARTLERRFRLRETPPESGADEAPGDEPVSNEVPVGLEPA